MDDYSSYLNSTADNSYLPSDSTGQSGICQMDFDYNQVDATVSDSGGSGSVPFGTQAKNALSSIGGTMFNTATSLGSTLGSLLDPSQARLKLAGLLGGGSTARSGTPVNWSNSAGSVQSAGVSGEDWRIRLSVAPGAATLYNLEGNNLLDPIFNTSGVIFPITPTIQVSHNAKYNSTSLTHSNYDMHFYEGSSVSSIMINGEFPIQNISEGQYLLAAIIFFRAATKMYWGQDRDAGTPPPMVYLDGLGGHYFPHVPCVITQFMHTLPDSVDYINIPPPGGGKSTRLPLQSQLQVTVQPIYSRSKVKTFDLEAFANGKMIGGGFI